ncbi:MAG: outer membrane protein assembly factor BamD [Bacteroidales bacterium]|nr:outer membrane protein assembly factor BamD [Bacteroidales bacterium]
MRRVLFRKLALGLRIACVSLFFVSCGEYQAILKSQDNELWFRKGMEYYVAGDYDKAANLLGGVITRYAGTSQYDTIVTTYASALVNLGDYFTAAHYYSDYVKTYPSSAKCEECQYMAGYCYYMLSPKVELDQADSKSAIDELLLFVNLFPDSPKVPEAERMVREMEDKLAYKAYLGAKLYFDLGNYMGNNYQSAVITAQNCLKKYPDTKHREELSFLILRAKYIQAEQSVLAKQADRYRDAIDEYYSFVNEFPVSDYRKDADKLLAKSQKGLAEAESLIPPSQDDLDYYKNYSARTQQNSASGLQD